jgi:mRNA-degrading endonuclease RelE of RelBE toxin-antitoxin system
MLESDPRPPWAKRLSGIDPPAWRFRVGRWRVLYDIDDPIRTVTARDVDLRDRVYRGI